LSHLADTQSQSSAQLHDDRFSGSFGARSHLKENAASRLLNAFAADSTAEMRAAMAGAWKWPGEAASGWQHDQVAAEATKNDKIEQCPYRESNSNLLSHNQVH
jgi:hypothetical protein